MTTTTDGASELDHDLVEALERLEPEALRDCLLAIASPLLEVALHERVDEVIAASMKKRHPAGGLAAIFDPLRAGLAPADVPATIRRLEAIERACDRHRVHVRGARLYETAAYLTAHAVGVTLHRKTRDVARLASRDALAAIAFYVLDRIHGTLEPGELRTLEGAQVHAAYAHRWARSEHARHVALAARAASSTPDALCAVPSTFASEVLAGLGP